MGIIANKTEAYVRQQLAGEGVNPRPAHATGTVHHDAVLEDGTVIHHHQVYETGELVEWVRDDAPGPWALVRHGDPFQPFAPSLPGLPQVRAAQVRLGERTVELPPLDDMYSPRWDELPTVPDATAWHHMTGLCQQESDVGTVWDRFHCHEGISDVCRAIERLGFFPRQSLFLEVLLHIPGGEVQTDGYPVSHGPSTTARHGVDQFDLVMDVVAERR